MEVYESKHEAFGDCGHKFVCASQERAELGVFVLEGEPGEDG